MTIEPEILRRCAEVMGIKLDESGYIIGTVFKYDPLEYASQLVECIEFLSFYHGEPTLSDIAAGLDVVCCGTTVKRSSRFASMPWKEAIVRAVAEEKK